MMSDLPQIEVLEGTGPGPVVGVLGAVHGDELEGVLAIRALVRSLRPEDLRGTLRWAAPAHPASWRMESRTGSDGVNLARVFPGDPNGRPTERVAAHLTTNLITGCDLLIDLHSAGRNFDMPLLVGFHSTGPLATDAAAAAQAFAAPLVWEHPESPPGRSLSAAETLGIPSIYVEGHGGSQVRQRDLAGYVDGVLRVLAHLGMINSGPPTPAEVAVVRGDGNTDEGITATQDGYFVVAVEAGDRVDAGQTLGWILDEDATPAAEIRSPEAGVAMLLRRHARVAAGDTLAIVAADVTEQIVAGQG